MGLLGLFPLVPLAKDGKRHELVEEMITGLAAAEKYELLSQAKTIAGLVFIDEAEREWLERIFTVYNDIIEESWVYQEYVQKGFEKGMEKGIRKGTPTGTLAAASGTPDNCSATLSWHSRPGEKTN